MKPQNIHPCSFPLDQAYIGHVGIGHDVEHYRWGVENNETDDRYDGAGVARLGAGAMSTVLLIRPVTA